RCIDHAPPQRFLRCRGNGMHEKVKATPSPLQALEDRLHLAGILDVQRQDDRGIDLAGQRLDILSGLLVDEVIASSAPSARHASARPQAIARSSAWPTIRPRLP